MALIIVLQCSIILGRKFRVARKPNFASSWSALLRIYYNINKVKQNFFVTKQGASPILGNYCYHGNYHNQCL